MMCNDMLFKLHEIEKKSECGKGYHRKDTVPEPPARDMPIALTLCPCTIVPENRIPLSRGTWNIQKVCFKIKQNNRRAV